MGFSTRPPRLGGLSSWKYLWVEKLILQLLFQGNFYLYYRLNVLLIVLLNLLLLGFFLEIILYGKQNIVYLTQDSKASVTSTVFLESKKIISAGACDGALKYWDLRKTYNAKKDPVAMHTIPFPGSGSRGRIINIIKKFFKRNP